MPAILRSAERGFSRRRLCRTVERALARLDLKHAELSVLVVDEPAMVSANRRFFGRAEPTDVIAVPQSTPRELALRRKSGADTELLLGDVIVCWDIARRQARHLGHSPAKELAILVLHGLLHTLGMEDHTPAGRRAMSRKVTSILRSPQKRKRTPGGAEGEAE